MKEVNIVVGRFQPLTLGHLKCVEEAWERLAVPTILCMIETPLNKLDERHPFPSQVLLPMYQKVIKAFNKIEGIVLVKNADIVKIADRLREDGYIIKSWTCGTDRVADYRRMLASYGEKAGVASGCGVIEVGRDAEAISATKVREMIKEGNLEEFCKTTPWGKYISLRTRASRDFETLRQWIGRL